MGEMARGAVDTAGGAARKAASNAASGVKSSADRVRASGWQQLSPEAQEALVAGQRGLEKVVAPVAPSSGEPLALALAPIVQPCCCLLRKHLIAQGLVSLNVALQEVNQASLGLRLIETNLCSEPVTSTHNCNYST